jgi:hypothetical protein
MHRRSRRLGLLTVLGLARRGFFIPYRFAETVPEAGTVAPYPAIEDRFQSAEVAFRETLEAVDRFGEALLAIGEAPPPAPRWTQDWFPTLDAAVAYAMVRRYEPARIIEVGSGHSTRFLKRAVDDGALPTTITAIDPEPRRGVDRLDIDLRRRTLSDVDPAVFEELQPGDILFIDSSHIMMPGSDVDDLLNRVLPRLPTGALVHIHDIFLPDDYPADWGWRGYNEQQAVALLVSTGGYEPLFASHYARTRMAAAIADTVLARLPAVATARPASVWLRKR